MSISTSINSSKIGRSGNAASVSHPQLGVKEKVATSLVGVHHPCESLGAVTPTHGQVLGAHGCMWTLPLNHWGWVYQCRVIAKFLDVDRVKRKGKFSVGNWIFGKTVEVNEREFENEKRGQYFESASFSKGWSAQQVRLLGSLGEFVLPPA